MRSTGLGTSLILIAVGAVLAFAVDYRVTGININTVGAILLVVGIIGIVLSLMMQGDIFGTSVGRRQVYTETHDVVEPPGQVTYTDVHTHPAP
jgi:Domain of unknown function (DUF6458)